MYRCENMETSDNQKTDTKKIICVVDPNLSLRQRMVSLFKNYSQDVKTFESAENFLIKLGATVPQRTFSGKATGAEGQARCLLSAPPDPRHRKHRYP